MCAIQQELNGPSIDISLFNLNLETGKIFQCNIILKTAGTLCVYKNKHRYTLHNDIQLEN